MAANLCRTCQSAQILRGEAESQERVYCHSMERFLRETIVECSRHRPANASSLYEMEARAWLIDVKTKNGRVGFVKPTERKPNDDIHYADPVADRF